MEKITVNILERESDYVFCLFYAYEASLKILRYLMVQKDLSEDDIKRYSKVSEDKYLELQIAKSEYAKKYCPKKDVPYTCVFDFDNDAIIYTYNLEGECNEKKI